MRPRLRLRRSRARLLGAMAVGLAIVTASVTASTSDAHADLWGPPGTLYDARWDEATQDVLSNGSYGNIVGMWQSVLRAYNQLNHCQVDGTYGSWSGWGTYNLQKFWSIPADGVVGNQTWGTAAAWSYYAGTVYSGAQGRRVYYLNWVNTDDFPRYYQDINGTFTGYWNWTSPAATGWGLHNTNVGWKDFGPVC